MSFPSIAAIISECGYNPATLTGEQAEAVLVEAVRRDCPEAVSFLHNLAHQAMENPMGVQWSEDPKCPLGQQLIRIHASDAVRRLVVKHVCHGQPLRFANCCNGQVGGPPPPRDEKEDIFFQIACQNGAIAYADC